MRNQNFSVFSSISPFCTLELIDFKFGTQKGATKAKFGTKFEENSIQS